MLLVRVVGERRPTRPPGRSAVEDLLACSGDRPSEQGRDRRQARPCRRYPREPAALRVGGEEVARRLARGDQEDDERARAAGRPRRRRRRSRCRRRWCPTAIRTMIAITQVRPRTQTFLKQRAEVLAAGVRCASSGISATGGASSTRPPSGTPACGELLGARGRGRMSGSRRSSRAPDYAAGRPESFRATALQIRGPSTEPPRAPAERSQTPIDQAINAVNRRRVAVPSDGASPMPRAEWCCEVGRCGLLWRLKLTRGPGRLRLLPPHRPGPKSPRRRQALQPHTHSRRRTEDLGLPRSARAQSRREGSPDDPLEASRAARRRASSSSAALRPLRRDLAARRASTPSPQQIASRAQPARRARPA